MSHVIIFFYGIKFQVHYTNLEQMYFLKLSLALQFFLVLKYLVICVSKSLRQIFFISFLFCPDCAPYDIKSTPSLIMYLTFDNIALKYHFKEYNIALMMICLSSICIVDFSIQLGVVYTTFEQKTALLRTISLVYINTEYTTRCCLIESVHCKTNQSTHCYLLSLFTGISFNLKQRCHLYPIYFITKHTSIFFIISKVGRHYSAYY